MDQMDLFLPCLLYYHVGPVIQRDLLDLMVLKVLEVLFHHSSQQDLVALHLQVVQEALILQKFHFVHLDQLVLWHHLIQVVQKVLEDLLDPSILAVQLLLQGLVDLVGQGTQ